MTQVLVSGGRLAEIVEGMSSTDPVVRMRCADVAEKVSKLHSDWLVPHKKTLLQISRETTEKEMRWHIAQMMPRLELTAKEQRAAVSTMFDYLNDESSIVRTFALQALTDFAVKDAALRIRVLPLLRDLSVTGTPAIRARARKLTGRLEALEGTADYLAQRS